MKWTVLFSKRVAKCVGKLPPLIQSHLESLTDDLDVLGPVRGDWPNYSKLGPEIHHCHLSYNYVAVWRVVNKKIRIMEVTYVGSRKDAPY